MHPSFIVSDKELPTELKKLLSCFANLPYYYYYTSTSTTAAAAATNSNASVV
jgi:hypothetical protein